MPEYEVTISGTAQVVINIQADDEDAAGEIAEGMDEKELFAKASTIAFDVDDVEIIDHDDYEVWDQGMDDYDDQDPIGDDTPDTDDYVEGGGRW